MKAATFNRRWDQLKADLKTRWGELTDDEMLVLEGRIDELESQLGHAFDQARDAVKAGFERVTRNVGEGVDRVRSAAAERADSLMRKLSGLRKRAKKLLR